MLASGGVGPGRLQVIGVNPLLAAGVLFVEVAVVSILAAFFSARPDAPDHPLVQSAPINWSNAVSRRSYFRVRFKPEGPA